MIDLILNVPARLGAVHAIYGGDYAPSKATTALVARRWRAYQRAVSTARKAWGKAAPSQKVDLEQVYLEWVGTPVYTPPEVYIHPEGWPPGAATIE